MERLGIAAAQRERPDILGIYRLPANRNLRLLRIIPAMRCWDLREQRGSQHCGGVGAIPFFSFGKVYLEAVDAPEVPCRTGEWHTYFFVDSPDVPIRTEALTIRRTDGVKGGIERVTIYGQTSGRRTRLQWQRRSARRED